MTRSAVARLPLFLAPRLATALAAGVVLLAFAGYAHLSWRRADPAGAEVFLAGQLRAVQDRATGLARKLAAQAAAAASLPEAAKALQGDRTALPVLFGSLEGQAGSGSPVALAVRSLPFSVVAWSGPASELRGLDESLLLQSPLFVLSGSVTTSLVAMAPVPAAAGGRRGFVTAEIVVRAHRNIRNEYLADFDLLSDGLPGVEIRYADFRDPFPDPFSPLPSTLSSRTSPLQTSDGWTLGMVRVSTGGLEVSEQALRLRYRRGELALGLLAILLFTMAPGTPRCGPRLRLLLGVTATRFLLFALGARSLPGAGPSLAGGEEYSSTLLAPWLQSPLDLLATVACLTVAAVLLLDWLGRRPSRAGPSPWRAAFALVASLLVLAGCFGWIHDTVLGSEIDLSTITLVPKSPAHLVLHGALLLILGAALALLGAAWSFARPLPRGRAGRIALALAAAAGAAAALTFRPREVALPFVPALLLAAAGLILGLALDRWRTGFVRADTGERSAMVLGLAALLALLLYPSLVHYSEQRTRRQIESDYAPLILDQPARRAEALAQSRAAVDGLRLLESEADTSLPAAEDLAFAVWSASKLAETAASSAVEIQDSRGTVISRFALSLPSLAATGPPQPLPPGEDWITTRETLTVATAERRVLHSSRRLAYNGQTRGAVHLYVGEGVAALPFLTPRDPYSALYRSTSGPANGAKALSLLVYDESSNPVFSSAERPPALSPEMSATLSRHPSGSWTTLPLESGPTDTFLFSDGALVFGLGYARLTAGRYGAGLLEAIVALTLAVLLPLFALMVLRTVLGLASFSVPALLDCVRRRFALRLFVAFVTLAVVPVAVLEGIVRGIVTERLRHASEDQALERAAVAQKAVEDFAFFQRREAAGTRPVTDAALVWVASLIRNDLDVFGSGRLIASSKRELYASGLLPSRISGSVFKDLVLEMAPSAIRSERIGAFSSLVASVPVRLDGPEPAILSIPLALRQRELQATLDEIDRTIRLASLGFFVVAAILAQSMSRRISGPLRALTAATGRIADGDFDARVATTNRDEILGLVTSFNQMAGDLQRQRRDLERSNRLAAWAEMARQVAHEVKNPLTPIQLSAEHLRRVYKDREVDFEATLAACTETILKQVRTLRGIVTEFSAFARPPDSDLGLEDLAALTRSVLAPYCAHLPPSVSLSLDAPDGLPRVRMDRRLVERAIVNVVENALQAVQEKGSVTVRLRAEAEGERVTAEIEDSGPGLTPEARERAFEPFFSTKTDGSGLGLALVKKIAEDHGGGVSLESRPGFGTRVSIWLPAKAGQ